MDEHLSLMSVHAKPSAPGETDVDAREVGRLVCGRKEDDGGKKGEGRTGNESPAPLRPAGGKLDLFAKVCRIFFFFFCRSSASRCDERSRVEWKTLPRHLHRTRCRLCASKTIQSHSIS